MHFHNADIILSKKERPKAFSLIFIIFFSVFVHIFGIEERSRVVADTFVSYLEMAVVAERVTGISDKSDELTLLNVLALCSVDRYHVTVYRRVAVRMFYHYNISVTAGIPAG